MCKWMVSIRRLTRDSFQMNRSDWGQIEDVLSRLQVAMEYSISSDAKEVLKISRLRSCLTHLGSCEGTQPIASGDASVFRPSERPLRCANWIGRCYREGLKGPLKAETRESWQLWRGTFFGTHSPSDISADNFLLNRSHFIFKKIRSFIETELSSETSFAWK